MIAVVEERADEVRRLCDRYGVQSLSLFGSAAAQDDGDARDLDFLVEFTPEAIERYADSYFGLLEELERLFGKPVDLVVESAIKNRLFLESVRRTRMPLYAG